MKFRATLCTTLLLGLFSLPFIPPLSAQTSSPDLYVKTLAFSNSQGYDTLEAEICNNGGATSFSQVTYVRFATPTTVSDPYESVIYYPISTNKCTKIYSNPSLLKNEKAGTLEVQVMVDPQNLIKESNETNNVTTATVTIPILADRIDLIVKNFTAEGKSLIVEVCNQSQVATVSENTYVSLSAELNHPSHPTIFGSTSVAEQLKPQACTNAIIEFFETIIPDTYETTLTVDDVGIIKEADDENNTLVKSIVFAPSLPTLSDLELRNVTFSDTKSSNPFAASGPRVSADICNLGDTLWNYFDISFFLDGTFLASQNFSQFADHHCTNLWENLQNFVPAGDHEIRAAISFYDGNDANPNNDSASASVKLLRDYAPDVTIKNVWFSKTIDPIMLSTAAGGGFSQTGPYMLAEVCNIGETVIASSLDVSFLLGSENISISYYLALRPGRCATSLADLYGKNIPKGTYDIVANADSFQFIAESNEKNNSLSKSITIPNDILPPKLANLLINEIGFGELPGSADKKPTLYAKICNEGKIDVPASSDGVLPNLSTAFTINDEAWKQVIVPTTFGFAVGECRYIGVDIHANQNFIPYDDKPHSISIFTDYYFQIPETDEYDNFRDTVMNFPFLDASLPPFPEGSLLKSITGPKIYKIEKGKKRWIENENAFNLNKFKWDAIVEVDDTVLEQYPDGYPITTKLSTEKNLIKVNFNPDVYLIENGQRRHIEDEGIFYTYGFRWQDIITVSPEELDSYPLGEPINYSNPPKPIAIS
ncbi:MAG: hypothetical protein HY453_00245 [Parcubacteria group bacterium]|nr:hypothetical protein [Parcubacteria group bacterium]